MELTYEDSDLVYEHGPKQSIEFSWPGNSGDSLAKFTLYDLANIRVVKVRGGGGWSFLRLLSKLYTRAASSHKLLVSYKKGSYMGSFEIEGNIATVFSKKSPLQYFELRRK